MKNTMPKITKIYKYIQLYYYYMTDQELPTLMEKYKKELTTFKYSENGSELKLNYFVKYIRRDTKELVKQGKLIAIVPDKLDKSKIYQITLKGNANFQWTIKLRDIYLFYREEKMVEIRKRDTVEWKNNLDAEEKVKWDEYQSNKNEKTKKLFYDWFNERRAK